MRMGMGDAGVKERRRRKKDDGAEERTKVKEIDREKRIGRGVTPEGMQRGSGCASSPRVWIDY